MSRALIYEYNVDIPMRDGSVLRANIYRPVHARPCPVVMSMGPYGKDRHLADRAPELARALGGGPFVNWETPDPDWWVANDYVVVRVDSRGSGQSPGFLAPFCAQIARDYHDAIEWAGVQPWSTGKVGTLGVSYYGSTQWAAATQKPPHLAAMIPWEAFSDAYRDLYRHGGILNGNFIEWWWSQSILNVQHGKGQLTDEALRANQLDVINALRDRPLMDAFYEEWIGDVSAIEVPFLSVGNLGNIGLHLRGNIEAFKRAASKHKWLRLIVGDHVLPAYTAEAHALQLKFFDHFLKGQENGWQEEPRVQVTLRSSEGLSQRKATQWPIEGTRWDAIHLDATTGRLSADQPSQTGSVDYEASGEGISFSTAPFQESVQVVGPVALRLWASSSLSDMDVFVRIRKIDAQGNDLVGIGPAGGHMALALGWLRASQRKLDATRSTLHQPVHTHDETQPLVPGEPVALDIEIWPTSIVFEPGSRLVLEIRGSDFEKGGPLGHGAADPKARPVPFIHFLHADAQDRPAERFGGTHTVLTGGRHDTRLLLPVIPQTTSR